MNQKSVSKPKLLTIPEVRTALRCSEGTVYTLLRTGRLARVKIGRRTMIDRADLAAFIRSAKEAKPA